MHANLKNMAKVTYTAELEPKAASSCELLRHSKDNSCRQVGEQQLESRKKKVLTKRQFPFSQATFLSLKKGEEYTLTIKTLVNGQSVGQITEKFNTNKLKNLQVKELTEDEDRREEDKTPAPQEENEDSGTYLEEIAEEKEKNTERETDVDPPLDNFEMQKLSKRVRNQTKRVSLEVIDEKVL